MSRKILLPISTVCITAGIIATVLIARVVLDIQMKADIAAFLSYSMESLEDSELNATEREVVLQLSTCVGSDNLIYLKKLKEHFCTNGINLSIEKHEEIKAIISELHFIINKERETDYSRMTLDARGRAIYLSQQIYELCGLNISYNIDGKINMISNVEGEIYYQLKMPGLTPQFQVRGLIITIFILLLLGFHSFMIAKNKRLYQREKDYEIIEEKGIA